MKVFLHILFFSNKVTEENETLCYFSPLKVVHVYLKKVENRRKQKAIHTLIIT